MEFFKKISKKTKYDKIIQKICFIIFVFVYINIHILYGLPVQFSISLIITILGAFAFFCFAWDKKILNKLFWQVIFVIGTIWKIGSLAFSAASFNSWSQLVFSDAVFITLATISYIYFPLAGLYYYGFRSDVWGR